MMTREGGMAVKTGFYWNLRGWQLLTVPRQGGPLPGGVDDRYVRVPVLLMLLLAPLMGALYVMFLPFIGFAMLASFVARKSAVGVRAAFMGVMATISPQWRPGEAYLAGKKKAATPPDRAPEEKGAGTAGLDELQREIEEKRADKGQ
jgi:hypothetical protein